MEGFFADHPLHFPFSTPVICTAELLQVRICIHNEEIVGHASTAMWTVQCIYGDAT